MLPCGSTQRLKPSRSASASRRSNCETDRNSPDSPISPSATRSPGTGLSRCDDAIASASDRSAAGSRTRRPPTTDAITSCEASGRPTRRLSTAETSTRRFTSSPLAVRRGAGVTVGLVSACTSTSSGRLPSSVGTIAEPTASPARSAMNASDGFATSRMPPAVISNTPTSSTEPKRFFTPRSSR